VGQERGSDAGSRREGGIGALSPWRPLVTNPCRPASPVLEVQKDKPRVRDSYAVVHQTEKFSVMVEHVPYPTRPRQNTPFKNKNKVQRPPRGEGGGGDAAMHVRAADQPSHPARPGASPGAGPGEAPRAQGRRSADGAGQTRAGGPGFRGATWGSATDGGTSE